MTKNKLPKLIVILGPTASGKTELAIKFAQKFKGEIVSADSRQVYKKMDIGTAKPSKKEIEKVSHHLIDVVNPSQEFNVGLYKKMAIKAIKDIQKRKKIPFLVGGTGLYIQAIVDNLKFPKVLPQKKRRRKLERKTEKELFEIYKILDPQGAKFIDKENKRRLIRAIEVCEITKKPFWQLREEGKPLFDILQIGIRLPKRKLKEKIQRRVEKMFNEGLEKEVRKLVEKYGWGIAPLQTIGYQEWMKYLKPGGEIKSGDVKKLIILHTLQFARRQMTWFKRDNRIHWTLPTRHPYRYAEKLMKKFLKK